MSLPSPALSGRTPSEEPVRWAHPIMPSPAGLGWTCRRRHCSPWLEVAAKLSSKAAFTTAPALPCPARSQAHGVCGHVQEPAQPAHGVRSQRKPHSGVLRGGAGARQRGVAPLHHAGQRAAGPAGRGKNHATLLVRILSASSSSSGSQVSELPPPTATWLPAYQLGPRQARAGPARRFSGAYVPPSSHHNPLQMLCQTVLDYPWNRSQNPYATRIVYTTKTGGLLGGNKVSEHLWKSRREPAVQQ